MQTRPRPSCMSWLWSYPFSLQNAGPLLDGNRMMGIAFLGCWGHSDGCIGVLGRLMGQPWSHVPRRLLQSADQRSQDRNRGRTTAGLMTGVDVRLFF